MAAPAPPPLNHCSRCGARLHPNVPFCPTCGADLPGRAGAVPLAPPPTGRGRTPALAGPSPAPAGLPLGGNHSALGTGDAAASAVRVPVYASFWVRLAALLIDLLLVSLLVAGVILAIAVGLTAVLGADRWLLTREGSVLWGNGVAALTSAVYFIIGWHEHGQTPGAAVSRLRVVRIDGRRLSWGAALARWLMLYVSAYVVGLGFLWMLWDEQRQTWHDKVAGSVVVDAE